MRGRVSTSAYPLAAAT